MKSVHSLVAENSAHFVDPIHATHDQALQIELRFDAHIHVDVQRVMVRLERTGVRSDFQRQKNGRVYFQIALSVKVCTNLFENF